MKVILTEKEYLKLINSREEIQEAEEEIQSLEKECQLLREENKRLKDLLKVQPFASLKAETKLDIKTHTAAKEGGFNF